MACYTQWPLASSLMTGRTSNSKIIWPRSLVSFELCILLYKQYGITIAGLSNSVIAGCAFGDYIAAMTLSGTSLVIEAALPMPALTLVRRLRCLLLPLRHSLAYKPYGTTVAGLLSTVVSGHAFMDHKVEKMLSGRRNAWRRFSYLLVLVC